MAVRKQKDRRSIVEQTTGALSDGRPALSPEEEREAVGQEIAENVVERMGG